ncbi:MAG: choice-of-anchor Q domain-containing protein, partial [Chthoniobacterales bacterium]
MRRTNFLFPGKTTLAALAFAALLHAADASTLTVNSSADSGGTCPGADCSLRQAILVATSGDTLAFQIPTSDPGYNVGTGAFTIGLTSNELAIGKDLTIDGGGQKIVIARTAGTFRIFNITAGIVNLTNLTIANGKQSSGAGIANQSSLTLRNCTLYGNNTGGGAFGGAIASSGSLQVSNCTFTANTADPGGSAIFTGTGDTTIDNSTIFSNTGNSAVLRFGSGTVRVRNTIIVGNPSADVSGTFISDGYNLIGTTSAGGSGFGSTGDKVGVTPSQVNLGPLQDNGGPTNTMAPKTASIALDQGHSGGVTTDQRGDPRPVHRTTATNVPGDFSDIGAVEIGLSQFPNSGANLTVTNTAEHNEHDCRVDECTLAEAIEVGSFITANGGLGPVTIHFAPGVSGVISNTTVPTGLNISAALTIIGPGARALQVTGGGLNRIFNITAAGAPVNVSGLSLTDGKA